MKSAILLAGLRAEGRTTVREAVATRDHTERMLRARGIAVGRSGCDGRRRRARGGGGDQLEGGRTMQAIDERVPGDVSAAAFWLVAAAIHPDADLVLRGVGVNPTRRAVIDLLRAMGADIDETPVASAALRPARPRRRRRRADRRPAGPLVGTARDRPGPGRRRGRDRRDPDPLPRRRAAPGTTTIRGAGELRHKESDRIAGIADGLAALGADIAVDGDDLRIAGGRRADGHDRGQPRRPPARDDLRDRRPHRDGRTTSSDRPARRSPTPASSTISEG